MIDSPGCRSGIRLLVIRAVGLCNAAPPIFVAPFNTALLGSGQTTVALGNNRRRTVVARCNIELRTMVGLDNRGCGIVSFPRLFVTDRHCLRRLELAAAGVASTGTSGCPRLLVGGALG